MKKVTPVLLSSLAIMLGACSSSDDDNSIGQGNDNGNGSVAEISCSKEGNITTVKVDASTQTAFLNLGECQSKGKAQQWDLAFNRANILVNASAKSAIADEQAEYYDGGDPASNVQPVADNGQQFANGTNPSPDYERDSLLNATSIIGSWINDGTAPAIDGGWYIAGHPLVASDQNYVIRSAEGNTFARMNANNITFTGRAYEVEFAFYIQGETDQQFANSAMYWTVTSGADACYDFDIPDEVNCSETGWDMKFVGSERMMPIYTNGGVSGEGNGAAYKMDDPNEYNSGRGTGAPTDTNAIPPMAYEQDKPAGAFTSYSWYAYDPLNDGTHQLLPNYRVYVVDTDASDSNYEPYKLQITDYYNDSGASGHISLRYMPLSQTSVDNQ